MRATRHNGRAGSYGVFNPKHNDREFDLDNNPDINPAMTPYNIYWNCFQGFTTHKDKGKNWMNFHEVELNYYRLHFSDWLDDQNERHVKAGHKNRVKEMEQIVSNRQRCPEETIYQIGNMEETIDYEILAKIVSETIQEINNRYGQYVTTLTWGLHVDEKTPHIHERHVFHSPNEKGFDMPVQDKTLEMMGFELPDKTKPRDKFNNRKVSYDEACRKIFLECCRKNGLEIEAVPIYGGRKHLEKTEFINSQINLKNQALVIENGKLLFDNDKLTEKQSELERKIADEETLVKSITDIAYDKACEVLVAEVVNKASSEEQTQIKKLKNWISSDKCIAPKKSKQFALAQFDLLDSLIKKAKQNIVNRIKASLASPEKKEELANEINEKAKPSIIALLNQHKTRVNDNKPDKNHKHSISEVEL